MLPALGWGLSPYCSWMGQSQVAGKGLESEPFIRLNLFNFGGLPLFFVVGDLPRFSCFVFYLKCILFYIVMMVIDELFLFLCDLIWTKTKSNQPSDGFQRFFEHLL